MKHYQRTNRQFGLSLLALSASLVCFSFTPQLAAWTQSPYYCNFDPAVFPSVTYEYNSVTSPNYDAFNSGQAEWDRHTNIAGGTYLAYSSGDVNIEVYDKNDSSDTRTAYWSFSCSGGYWSSDEGGITFNDYHMPSSTYAKKVVAIHEIGHAYGLGHVSMNCDDAAYRQVMEQGSDKWTDPDCPASPPWSNDVTGWSIVNS